jgi:hypothetical protein
MRLSFSIKKGWKYIGATNIAISDIKFTFKFYTHKDTHKFRYILKCRLNIQPEINSSWNYFSTDPPENVKLTLTRNGDSATIECSADAQPPASFKIFLNKTTLVKSDKTHTISEVRSSDVGSYICFAENILGNKSSDPVYLSLEGKVIFFVNPHGINILVTNTDKSVRTTFFILIYFFDFCFEKNRTASNTSNNNIKASHDNNRR